MVAEWGSASVWFSLLLKAHRSSLSAALTKKDKQRKKERKKERRKKANREKGKELCFKMKRICKAATTCFDARQSAALFNKVFYKVKCVALRTHPTAGEIQVC